MRAWDSSRRSEIGKRIRGRTRGALLLQFVVAAVLAGLAGATPAARAQVITDGDFSTWTFDSTGTASVTREASGGNPGARLNVTTVSGSTVFGTAIKSDFSTGALLAGATFSLSFDVKSGSGAFGQGQSIQLLVEQGGTIYGLSVGVTGFPRNFDTVTFNGTLNAGSFTRLIGAGPSTPTFDGSVVTRFGFAAGNTSSGTLTQYYDNFRLELSGVGGPVVAVPALSLPMYALLGLALTAVGLLLLKR